MKQVAMRWTTSLLLILVVAGLTGCDTFEIFDRDKEVQGTVEEIGADYLVVDAIRYTVTSSTEYEGISGLGDLSVGDEVEVEYEEQGGSRTALEVELAGAEDDDGGLFG